MGTPWGYGPVEFEVNGGEANVVELRVPHRGRIRQLVLNEVDGASNGTFELYNSEDAARTAADSSNSSASLSSVSSESSESSIAFTHVTSPAAYSVMGEKTITAGSYSDYDLNQMFSNRDGTPTNPVRRLWMVITPVSIGSITYAMSMVIEMPDLGS